MGQKIHPSGFRIGIIHDWKSNWFSEKEFGKYLIEDVRVRDHIRGKLAHAGLSDIHIRKDAQRITIDIFTARPGIVIGKSGSEVEALRQDLHTLTGKAIHVNINEIKRPELDANLVAQSIAEQLQNRVSFRRAMKRSLASAMRSVRGTRVSPARPAFGFRLDVTTRAEIDSWVEQHHLECRDRRERTLLTCDTVPASAIGRDGAPLDEVSFAFTPVSLRLVNLTAVRYRLSPTEAVRHAGGVKVQLQSVLGDPTRAAGVLDPTPLGATDYATVAVFYEFSDYIADLTATNIPGQGVLVREHYMSAVENPTAARAGG